MRNHKNMKRAFVIATESWYYDSAVKDILAKEEAAEEVTVGFYDEDGGTTGELSFKWYRLRSNPLFASQPAARLESFCDSWSALWMFRDLLEAMARLDTPGSNGPTPQEFVELLKRLGFEDKTRRTRD